jgi:hypothetical protein
MTQMVANEEETIVSPFNQRGNGFAACGRAELAWIGFIRG